MVYLVKKERAKQEEKSHHIDLVNVGQVIVLLLICDLVRQSFEIRLQVFWKLWKFDDPCDENTKNVQMI